ncbi:hypothetical protein LMIY3S_01985 [Labrys miyagiensis]
MDDNRVVFLFPHILKCAGLSVRAFLMNDVPAEQAILIYSEKERDPWLKPLERVPSRQREALRILYGHRLPRSALAGFPDRPIREIGLLRDPVSWCVSMYNFLQTAPERHGVKGWSFDKWYGTIKRNRISRFYLKHYYRVPSTKMRFLTERNRFDFLSDHFQNFWFVGDYRNCDDVVARIAAEIDVPFEKLPRVNAASDNSFRVQDLSETMRQRIREENALDQALYEAWSKRLWDGRPELDAGRDLPSRWTWNNIAS